MSTTAVRRSIIISVLVTLIAVVIVGAMLLWAILGSETGLPTTTDMAATVDAIYATNTRVNQLWNATLTATAATTRADVLTR